MDPGTRLLIQLCHMRRLDFADFAMPDNALEGALGHLLNTKRPPRIRDCRNYSDHSRAEATIASRLHRSTF
jgi:hypothetical protein